MEQITIGTSGLTASRIGCRHSCHRRLDVGRHRRSTVNRDDDPLGNQRGVTLIDTAPAYGFGRSEEIVGKALAEGGLRTTTGLLPRWALGGGTARCSANSRPVRIRQEIKDSSAYLPAHRGDRPRSSTRARSQDTNCGKRPARRRGTAPRGQDPSNRSSAMFAAADGTSSAGWQSSTPCSRLTTSSNARSRALCCRMLATRPSTAPSYGSALSQPAFG